MIVERWRTIGQACFACAVALCLTACGGSSSSSSGTGSGTPVITQADLSGTYVYTITGQDPTDGDYATAGSFTADGKGGIASAVADYNLGSGIDGGVPMTGTYTVANGVATIQLTDSGAVQETYTVPVVKTGTAVITKLDGSGSGTLYVPATGTFSPAGTYMFSVKGEGEGTVTASGSFVAGAAGAITSGTETYTDGATMISYPTIDGFLNTAQSGGRGTAVIAGSDYAFYVASASQLVLVGQDDRSLLSGTASKQ